MSYPIKTLSQLSLLLKAFRKEKGLTQAAMAERLGISQQSYAYFELNPAAAPFERFFKVLRLLDVEIFLQRTAAAASIAASASGKLADKRLSTTESAGRKRAPVVATQKKEKPAARGTAVRIAPPTRNKESW